ncbi:LysR family transcriptional regulator [Vibrio hannami]|uniref:LysR family transcriptional regulator n=1 Tax=Vibrio hannami TaxID=2717094 RepID=UPI002410AC27|nr:LysR family transcriptional regulator [Vibrio hannami]MDG3086170.1 LysR family transcriptional regulator [Vibrio hannami]
MRNSDLSKLREFDFNLLKTLLVILEQKHISKSAELLFITQPAVSKQLSKLREMFDDPLLVRVGNQQILTPKATRIHSQVEFLCQQFLDLVSPETLNLAEVTQSVSVMHSDYGSPKWMTRVINEISNQAPNVTITCQNWSEENIYKLISGEINFALGRLPNHLQHYEMESLGTISSALIARKDHPIFSNYDSLEKMIPNYPIVQIRGSDAYQTIYNDLVRDCTVLLEEATLWLALETIKSTNAFLIGPSKFIDEVEDKHLYQSVELPMLKPLPIAVCWTAGLTNDLFFNWVKEKIIGVGREATEQKN